MKKNRCGASYCTASVIKCLLMMKIVLLLICGFTLQSVANNGFAQERITLKLENATLRKAFKIIEKQSSFRFVYNDEVLPADQKITISVQEQPVNNVMNKLLENTALTFRIVGSDLIVISSDTKSTISVDIPPPAFTVTGRVANSRGEAISNASILEKGTTHGTATKEDGTFSIDVASGNAVLVVSSVGFNSQEVGVNGRNSITIALQENANDLNQVIVVGYGTQKRSDITGAVASVPKSRLSQLPVTNIMHALEGAVAGVNISQPSAVPGTSANVLVRGQNSINANTSPLIVVDGIPFNKSGGLTNDINPNDIESIQILKDASAVAIYGTNGANGVILITTKRGNTGKPVIRYNTYVGFDDIPHILEPSSPEEYVTKYATSLKQRGFPQTNVLENQFEIANYNANKTVDWLDVATQQGVIQDHNLSISGGTKDAHYYISGEYMKQKGVVPGYQYNRASIRANFDVNITDYLTAGTSLFFTSNNSDGGRANFYLAAAMSPYGTLYNASGNYEVFPMYQELLYTNPMLGLYTDRVDRSKNLNGTVFAEVKPTFLKGLKYRINASYAFRPARAASYTGRAANNLLGAASSSNSETNSWVIENILSYTKDFGDHHIDFTGLYSAQERSFFITAVNATGFINDELSFNNLGAGANLSAAAINIPNNSGSGATINNTGFTGSYSERYGLLSQMARINYSYKGRYLFTATARRDGSSVFGANTNKYGVFPSVAVGWNISQESFMANVEFVNNLKLRGSYGKSGNEAINVYGTVTTAGTNRFPFNGVSTIGVLARNLGNANLNWESTTGFNMGLEFAILKNRINGTIDFYKTKTEDILLSRRIPIITGYESVLDNLGKTENTGIEISLNTTNVKTTDFQWETTINFSSNKNELVSLYGDGKNDIGNRWFLGKPIRVNYDYQMVGIWQAGEDASQWDPGAKPGDLKFADVNGDKKITADDKVVIGQQDPKWIGGITNTFHYKNFHLNVFIQTVQGATKNKVTLTYADEGGRMNTPKEVGYWTAENKSNTRPALSYFNTRGYGYPVDNSFTRIKDISLSYTFSQNKIDKIGLAGLTVYVSGRNLYTFTNWIGWDPEYTYYFRGSSDWTNNYPNTRSIVLGANISLR
jgi:TonB-linked SusC/RagA family outer membrane protein